MCALALTDIPIGTDFDDIHVDTGVDGRLEV
jgi:hypothetical protein